MAEAMPPQTTPAEVRQRRRWTSAAAVLAIGAFLYFAYYRVRYIGGCDSSAYLIESWRLRGLDVGLARDPSVPQQGALVPLCMAEHAGIVRSFFPPGFSLLLAGAGLIGLEFYLTPSLGALSGFVLFCLARSRVGAPLALATMMAWLGTPLALWGSTQVMSDLPAATFLLGALFAAEQKKTALSGLLLGGAMGLRPETVLFLPALIVFLPSRAEGLRLALGLVAAGLGWLAFFLASFGSLDLPYAGNLAELNGENFGRQLTFLSGETARQHAPVVALALVAFVRSPRICLPYLLWFAPFLVLHALWRVPYDAWWHVRFLLPALPALFLLAALGAASLDPSSLGSIQSKVIRELRSTGKAWRSARLARQGGPNARSSQPSSGISDALGTDIVRYALGTVVLTAYVVWCFAFAPASIHRITDWDERYARESRRIAARLPDDALVGAGTYSAPLRYYGRVETFLWCHADAPALIRWALAMGRPVYAVLEGPVESCDGRYSTLLPDLDLTLVEKLSSDCSLVQLSLTVR